MPYIRKDHLSEKRRSWNMSRIKGKNTAPELIVRSLLHRMGYRFRLHRKDLPGKPDIVMPKFRIVILVHGCFWHRHRGCANCTTPTANRDSWLKKFEDNIKRDKRNQATLKKLGWHVLTVWECQIKELEKLEKNLLKFIKSRQKAL